MTADMAHKAREARARWAAKNQDLTLTRSKKRDPYAIGYGTYTLLHGKRMVAQHLDLDGVEKILRHEA